jgi:hydrogenase maturation protein HypF
MRESMEPSAKTSSRKRRERIQIAGTVQGVGFRPFVYRLARELELGGWVLNDEQGVLIEVEGQPENLAAFGRRLHAEAPPLASVDSVASFATEPTGERRFRIVESRRAGPPEARITPDTATCDDCLAELFDPADRRYRYPFVNCTNCGPRFTIVRGVPYDRALTTMAAFEMCSACRSEYEDPESRRFHAQPNACPRCGPSLRLAGADGRELDVAGCEDAIAAAAAHLRDGGIVAVKGIGGFHLACRADDDGAVATLRSRKYREGKPFALMARDLGEAGELIEITDAEERLLGGIERPIVIARRRLDASVASAVAPRSPDLGVMLAYSPLHHVLLSDAGGPLVMTSGNVSDEPIAFEDDEALERLGGIADAFLLHDRAIETRMDDSVVRAVDPGLRTTPLLMRRSRGYVPRGIDLPTALDRPVLGCGAELKSTFCVASGQIAWVGHHIGDLKNWETLRSYRSGIEHFERLFEVEPEIVAHDLHPDYLSTRHATELEGVELVAVQHHHAHLAACLAEHAEHGPAVGAIFDGSGYGPDNTVWGGEILVGDSRAFDRRGWLLPVPLPGGDAAVREPWRMACSWLVAAEADAATPPEHLRASVGQKDWDAVRGLCEPGAGSPVTSSVGRLFDAVAALLGIRAVVSYEGQAAAELEGAARLDEQWAYPLPWSGSGADDDPATLDARETIRRVLADLERGVSPEAIAAWFHNAVADATATACAIEAERSGLSTVVLSGGVFQNRLLLERAHARLRDRRLRVLVPTQLPPNDGGISFGQVAVAASRLS